MKKISSFLLVTLFLSVTAFAQERSNDALPQNGIKLNVSSLMFSHLAFQYERVIGRKMTVCMGLRIRPNMKFGNSNTFQNQNTNANDVLFTDVRYGSLAFTPEFRYYFKEAMRGFYVAPYLRYRNTPFEIGFQYRDDNGYLQRHQFSGNINAFIGSV